MIRVETGNDNKCIPARSGVIRRSGKPCSPLMATETQAIDNSKPGRQFIPSKQFTRYQRIFPYNENTFAE